MVRFRVLGSLEVEVDGVVAELGGARQRAVLAVLLMHANEPVATDRLVSESWGEAAPATATKTAQVYVSRLRRTLGNDTLTTTAGGYLLRVPRGALDVDELEDLRARAREADPREAARLLRQGLALWRGPPYADLRYEEALQAEIARLEELRLTTLEERIEADLAAGEASPLVPELEALVREHPLRERLRGFLMLALYRSGRQAEALETYRHGRQLLDDELGLEPGLELRELERAILAHDPALEGPRRAMRRVARRRSGALLAAGGVLLLAAALTAVVLVRDRGEEGSPEAPAPRRSTRRRASSWRPSRSALHPRASLSEREQSGCSTRTTRRSRSSTRRGGRSRVYSARRPPRPTSPQVPGRSGSGTRFASARSRLRATRRASRASTRRRASLLPRFGFLVPSVVRYNVASRVPWLLEHIAVTSDAVWVVGADLGVYRIDPRTNQRVGGRVQGRQRGGHRRRRRRRLGDRVWGGPRREDRSAHEHDHAEDPSLV